MDPQRIVDEIAAIVKEIGIGLQEVARRKAYLKLEDRDLVSLRAVHEKQVDIPALIEAFYRHLSSFEETRAFLSDDATSKRLREAMILYFDRLTAGDYGATYVENRVRIGLTHQRIGLEPKWYFGTYALYLSELLPKLWEASGKKFDRFSDLYCAVLKVVFFDMGLAIDAYRHADQQAISTIKNQLQNVLSSMPLGMLLLSEDLKVLSANLAFREMQGDRDGEFRGKFLHEVLPASGLTEWARLVIQQGRQHQIMIEITNFRGDRRVQMVTMRAVRYAVSDHARLLLMIEDITERQRAEQAVRESRDLMLDFLENANDLIQSVSPEGRFQFVNRAWLETFGYREEDLPHLTLIDLVHPDNQEECKRLFERVKNGESLHSVQMVFVTRDGRPITVEGNINSRMEEGKSVVIRSIFRDITKRKIAEEELRRTEVFLNSVIENIPNMIFVKDARDFRFVRFNKAGEALIGFSREDLIGKNDYDFFPKEQADFFIAKDQEVITQGRLVDIPEEPIQTRHLGTRILHTKKIPLFDGDGKPLYLVGISEDITERKQAEERLKKSEAQLAAAQEIAHLGSWNWDLSTGQITWSDELYRIFGFKPNERVVTYEAFLQFLHPDDRERIKQIIEAALQDHQPFSCDYRMIRSDGAIRILHAQGEVICDEAGRAVQMFGAAQDVTEHRKAEEELRWSEERFRQVTESISEVFWMTSIDKSEMLYVSPAYWEIWGNSPKKLYENPRAWLDAIHPEDRERVIAAFPKQASGEYDLEYRILRPDGSTRWIRDRAFPIRNAAGAVYRIAGIAEDITQRKKAEEALQKAYKELQEAQAHLLQSEKMASLGQMAAGVAHEINNPVGFVSSNLRTLEEYMADLLQLVGGYEALLGSVERGDPEAVEGEKRRVRALSRQINIGFLMDDLSRLIEQSLEGMERVRRIVQDLKEFSHVDQAERMRFSVNQGIESTLNIVWNELKYKAEVIKALGEIPEIIGYPQQINQVFVNILMNAAQAITQWGKIWIRSRVQGEWIVVEIEDTGCGIAPENIKKIFDPFFTTKPVGKGTGLGLSVSYGIVQKHRGKIEVESTLNKGTTFRVFLPIAE